MTRHFDCDIKCRKKSWYLKVQYILFYLYQHSNVLKKSKKTRKCEVGTYHSYLLNNFTRRLISSNDKKLLYIPKSNLKSYGGLCFKCYGPYVWNSLPQEIRDSDSFEHFKKDLLKYLLVCKLSMHLLLECFTSLICEKLLIVCSV